MTACLLCDFEFSQVNIGRKHYIEYHDVDESDQYFLELFQPDTTDRVLPCYLSRKISYM